MDMSNGQIEEIKRLYGKYCHKESVKPYEEYNPEVIQVIQQMLDILQLEIKGINVQ